MAAVSHRKTVPSEYSTLHIVRPEAAGEKPLLTKTGASAFRNNPAAFCEAVYEAYHRPEFVSPDPLELVRPYTNPADREVAALVASSLALGRVDGICRVVGDVLTTLGSPAAAVRELSAAELGKMFSGFVYRFFRADHLVLLLSGTGALIRRYGSLERALATFLCDSDGDLRSALGKLRDGVVTEGTGTDSILLADARRQSAAKRLHLFLRWVVRRDCIDPGGWTAIAPHELHVPVDTHMLAICSALGLTGQKAPDARAVADITSFFASIRPDDPVRYDFSLTRLGIHPDLRNL